MIADLSHLRRISTVRSGKNIKFLTPAVYSGGWCPMRIACNIVENTPGLSYLMVCMPECATYSRGFNSLPEGENGEKRWLYVLDANEVIFGCREGVCDALRQMEAEGAEAVMMVATCVTDLIGEDFEGIISEMQAQLNMKLTYVTLGQFKNFGTPMGTSKVGEALVPLMKKAEKIEPKTANVLFIEPWKSKTSPVKLPLIISALEERGIRVRHITSEATLKDIQEAPDAALNLVISPYMQAMAERMEKEFGTPYISLQNAFRVEDVDAAYAQIEEKLNVSLAGAFDGWRKKALELEAEAAEKLNGITYADLTEVDMPVALAGYLSDFGMKPLLIHLADILPADIQYAKMLRQKGIDPPVTRIMNQELDVEVIRDTLHPDLALGYVKEPLPGMPCCEEMTDFSGITGYERAVGILRRILTVRETGKMEQGGFDIYGPAPV
ncbi:MAG: nitrogenase component 1 [Oscillospiraceae bacterium]|nr:nitrogenase component 1 [Oscillospiraceae bacterium]